MQTMNISTLFVVEWSESQKTFHVSQADDMIRENLECFYHQIDPDDSDWKVVGIANSYELAHSIVRQLKVSMDAPPPSSR